MIPQYDPPSPPGGDTPGGEIILAAMVASALIALGWIGTELLQ
jgi:hypothetical protein